MMKTVLYALACLNTGSLVIVVGLGLVRWGQLSRSLRLAWWALLSYLTLFVLSLLSASRIWTIGNNLFLEYMIPALFGTLFAIAFALDTPAGWQRWVIGLLAVAGLAGLGSEALWQHNLMGISHWAVPLQTVLNTIITLVYLQNLLGRATGSLLTIPLFWLSMGRLTSALISIIYDALHAQLMASSRDLLLGWIAFQMVVMILANVFYGIGYWKVRVRT
jgi:hypothetical protein